MKYSCVISNYGRCDGDLYEVRVGCTVEVHCVTRGNVVITCKGNTMLIPMDVFNFCFEKLV